MCSQWEAKIDLVYNNSFWQTKNTKTLSLNYTTDTTFVLLPSRAPTPPWPSASRHTTACITWWPRQLRPWGSGWMWLSQEQRVTHSSWTKRSTDDEQVVSAGTLPSQTGRLLKFPVLRTHHLLVLLFVCNLASLISPCRCFHLHVFYVILFGFKKGGHTLTHTSVYKPNVNLSKTLLQSLSILPNGDLVVNCLLNLFVLFVPFLLLFFYL